MTFGAVYIVRFLQKRHMLSLNLPKTKIAQAREIVKTVNLTFQGVRKETFLPPWTFICFELYNQRKTEAKQRENIPILRHLKIS